MADELNSESISERRFSVTRRGYDRTEVDAFTAEMAARFSELESKVAAVSVALEQTGLSELPDLKAEIEAVGAQVSGILNEARSAAEQMRSRATADAGRWRAEAAAEAKEARDGATRDSQKARRDAWETSTEMLTQAQQRQQEMLGSADQDALFIRAEAEREALRLTGDARRDAEELIRDARGRAERLLMEARAESESLVEQARRSAEAAQERARALEHRRTELMSELEAARSSIGELDDEIEARRETLQPGQRHPGSGPAEAWGDSDASVRIVPASYIPEDLPVDADALVAEVEALRERRVRDQTAQRGAAPAHDEEEQPVVSAIRPHAASHDDGLRTEPGLEAADAPSEQVEQDDAADTAGGQVELEAAEEPEPDEDSEIVDEVEQVDAHEDGGNDIDDLFASLRTSAGPGNGEVLGNGTGDAASGPASEAEDPTAPEQGDERASTALEVAVAEPAGAADPFDVRDRQLLPIANRALRSVKREIVELQNRVLEELRVANAAWQPDPTMFAAALSTDISRLVQECFVAGHAGAAELVGEVTTPEPSKSPPAGRPQEFVEALAAAVAQALARATTEGGGARQVSAAVSKVFRAWRTDEAERRLRYSALAAYHAGVVAALPVLGAERVMAVAQGRPCGECAAGSGIAWLADEDPPSGSVLPPGRQGCEDTVVPAA